MIVRRALIYLAVFLYLFLTTTVAAQVGVEQVGTASSLLLVVMAAHSIGKNGLPIIIANFGSEVLIIILGAIIILIKILIGDISGVAPALFFIIIPMLASILLGAQTLAFRKGLAIILIVYFLIECALAIFERLFLFNAFPYEDVTGVMRFEDAGFRSTALMGHPLQNAVCVSVVMGYVLISKYSMIVRVALVSLGYTALLCFNARGATLVWTVLIPVTFLFAAFGPKKNELFSLPMVGVYIFFVTLIYDLIVNKNFGDRLFQGELIDGSALTRVDVFDSFAFIDGIDFWLGNSESYLKVMELLGAGGVENSYIVLILNFGILSAVLLIVAYMFWMRRLLQINNLGGRMIVLVAFVLVGSLNNSLASSSSWIVFIICVNSLPYYVANNGPRVGRICGSNY